RHLVNTHRLVGPSFTVEHARRTQPAAPLGRIRHALLRVPVAEDSPAAAAGFETRRAGGVVAPPLGAESFVRRAVRHPTGLADTRVLLASGLVIHVAVGDAVIGAEVLGAHRAAQRAGSTGAVPVL